MIWEGHMVYATLESAFRCWMTRLPLGGKRTLNKTSANGVTLQEMLWPLRDEPLLNPIFLAKTA